MAKFSNLFSISLMVSDLRSKLYRTMNYKITKNIEKRACIIAGHSGGHILPCITIANKNFPEFEKLFITTNNGFDKSIIVKATGKNSNILELNTKKIPNKFYILPIFGIKLFIDFCRAVKFLRQAKPEIVITSGGLVSIPGCLAAKILGIKTEIYELNVEPGKATKFLSKFFKNIKICFPETADYFKNNNCIKIDYPVRFNQSCLITKELALEKLNFDANKKTIFILGGSQGSLSLNLAFKNFIENYKKEDLQIIHQIGINDKLDWHDFYLKRNLKAVIFDYNDKIEELYQAADLIICRAGAGTLAEVAFFNKRCLAIPLETGYTKHQIYNALAMSNMYPNIICVKQSDLDINQYC